MSMAVCQPRSPATPQSLLTVLCQHQPNDFVSPVYYPKITETVSPLFIGNTTFERVLSVVTVKMRFKKQNDRHQIRRFDF